MPNSLNLVITIGSYLEKKMLLSRYLPIILVTLLTRASPRNTPPTLFIAGDSTAAKDDGSPLLLGWGEKIGQYLRTPVVNDAVSGATVRVFTEQGYCMLVLYRHTFDFST